MMKNHDVEMVVVVVMMTTRGRESERGEAERRRRSEARRGERRRERREEEGHLMLSLPMLPERELATAGACQMRKALAYQEVLVGDARW